MCRLEADSQGNLPAGVPITVDFTNGRDLDQIAFFNGEKYSYGGAPSPGRNPPTIADKATNNSIIKSASDAICKDKKGTYPTICTQATGVGLPKTTTFYFTNPLTKSDCNQAAGKDFDVKFSLKYFLN